MLGKNEKDGLSKDLEQIISKLYSLATQAGSPIKASMKFTNVKEAVENIASLKRTIETYAIANKRIPHIALVGQFSGGKSSLINALARDNLRAIGEDPIDKVITIISHNDEIDQSAKQHSYTLLPIAVISQQTANQFFKTRHLVDMPGSGDEDKLHKLVSEFLPVCDCIFYLTPTSHALEMSEASMLEFLHSNLREIPLGLVVTQMRKYRSVTDPSTFDEERAKARIAKIKNRLVDRFGSLPIREALIFGIDNHEEDDYAREKIDWTDVEDAPGVAELRIAIENMSFDLKSMHSAKVELFSRWTRDRAAVLWLFLEKLHKDVTDLIEKVEGTKEQYRASYDDGLARFQSFWSNSSDSIDRLVDDLTFSEGDTIAAHTKKDEREQFFDSEIQGLTKEAVVDLKGVVRNLVEAAKSEAEERIAKQLRDLNAKIDSTSVTWVDEFPNLRPEAALQSEDGTQATPFITSLENIARSDARKQSELIRRLINSGLDAVGPKLNQLTSNSYGKIFLDKEEKMSKKFRGVQRDQIPKILEQFEGYRSIVFVTGTNELIGQTGFGKDLDEILDADKLKVEAVMASIERAIFGKDSKNVRRIVRASLRTANENFEEILRDHDLVVKRGEMQETLKEASKQVTTRVNTATFQNAQKVYEDIHAELKEKHQPNIIKIVAEWREILKNTAERASVEMKEAQDRNRRRLRNRIWMAGAAGFVVFLLIVIAANIGSANFSQVWAKSLGYNILASAIFSIGVYVYNAFMNPAEKLERNSRELVLKNARKKAIEEISKLSMPLDDVSEEKLEFLFRRAEEALLLDVKQLSSKIREEYARESQRLSSAAADIDKARADALGACEAFSRKMADWYSSSRVNTDAIKDELSIYKNKSIDEALKLFRQRQSAVKEYMDQIEAVFGRDRLQPAIEQSRRSPSLHVFAGVSGTSTSH